MRKQLLFVAMFAMVVGMTSCHKEDLQLVKTRNYRIQGEIDPGLCLPLIGSGQMSFGDLLAKFDGNFSNNILVDSGLIIFHYDTMVSTRLDIGNMMDSKSRKAIRYKAPSKSSGNYITVDTIIHYPINIDLFKQTQLEDVLNSDISIQHLWLDLSAKVFGGCSPNIQQSLRENSTIAIDALSLKYTGRDGVERDFDGNENLKDSLVIHDIIEGDSVSFKKVDMASIINSLPQQVVATFHLKINVDEDFAFSLMDTAVARGSWDFSDMLDSLDFSWLQFDINMGLNFPFEIRIGNLSYDYEIPISQNATNEEGQSERLSDLIDSVKGMMKARGISLDLDTLNNLVFEFDNDIPLNIKLNATFIDNKGNETSTLFTNAMIASANTAPVPNDPGLSEAVSPKTSRIKVPLNMDVLEDITKAKKVKFTLGLSTDGTDKMSIKTTNFLNVRMKLQLHPELTINMPLFGGK